jgi:hypothetical protein
MMFLLFAARSTAFLLQAAWPLRGLSRSWKNGMANTGACKTEISYLVCNLWL